MAPLFLRDGGSTPMRDKRKERFRGARIHASVSEPLQKGKQQVRSLCIVA
ncbi:hypothetical protein [Desulfosoma sp.]